MLCMGAMRRGPGAMGEWVVGASGVQVTGVGARDGVGGNANNNLQAAEVVLVVQDGGYTWLSGTEVIG